MSRRLPDGVARLLGTRTLAGRLAWSGVAWIAAWALALLVAFDVLLSHVLAGQVDDALRARAEVVMQVITVQGASFSMTDPENDPALDAGTTIYEGFSRRDGRELAEDLQQTLVQRGEQTADREIGLPTRYLAYPITSGGRQIGTIVVSSDTGEFTRTEKVVVLASAGFIVMMLGFTFFALRSTVVRAMRPVRSMGDQASAWSDRDLDRRFDPHSGPLELRQLAQTLNTLLDRISAALRHERQFSAELAHELRTPLAHLHAEADLLASGDAAPVVGEDVARMQTSIHRLEMLVEGALAPARLLHQGAPGVSRVSDVVAGLPSPPDGLELVITGDVDLQLAVEEDLARRALVPVVENAWRFADTVVRISASAEDGVAHVRIADDGGRLLPAAVSSVFEPGVRCDPADDHPGAGLGLALTRRICRSAGGDATAAVHDGWTEFTLTLPAISRRDEL